MKTNDYTIAQINIYRAAGTWYGARFGAAGEYDGCDEIDASSEAEARAIVQDEFPAAAVTRVPDIR